MNSDTHCERGIPQLITPSGLSLKGNEKAPAGCHQSANDRAGANDAVARSGRVKLASGEREVQLNARLCVSSRLDLVFCL
jgi:hypothetical protein